MPETTTIRIPIETKDLLVAHKDGDESLGDVVSRLAQQTPVNNAIQRQRHAVASYLRTYFVRDFGDARDELTPGEELWHELNELQYPKSPGEDDLPGVFQPTGIVLDHMTLVALARGHRLLAQLLYAVPGRRKRHVFVPAQALHSADIQNPGLAQHISDMEQQLGVLTTLGFDTDAAMTLGRSVPYNTTSAVAHVVHVAQSSHGWPKGRPVVTTVPGMYESGWRLKLRAVSERG